MIEVDNLHTNNDLRTWVVFRFTGRTDATVFEPFIARFFTVSDRLFCPLLREEIFAENGDFSPLPSLYGRAGLPSGRRDCVHCSPSSVTGNFAANFSLISTPKPGRSFAFI